MAEYEEATSVFSQAVKELCRKIGTSPKEAYKRLERISSVARVNAEHARLAWSNTSLPTIANPRKRPNVSFCQSSPALGCKLDK